MPIGVFVLTLAVTVLAVFAIERADQQRRQAQINEIANAVAFGLERRIQAHSAYLRSGSVLFSALPVTRETFVEFARASGSDETTAGNEGTAWSLRVPATEIANFEARYGAPVQPAPRLGDPFAVAITWIEYHVDRGMRPVGYNLYADPVRRAALDEAMRINRPVASGTITLLGREPEAQRRGFLVVMPVFERGGDPAAPQLRGFLSSGFAAGKLLAGIIRQEKVREVGVALYDGVPTVEHRIATFGGFEEGRTSRHLPVTLARRPFVLAVQPEPGVTLSRMSILTLLFGLLVAALLTIVATLISRKGAEDRAALLWFQEQASIRNSLTRELNHRVKNTLANVLSIIALTRRRADNVDAFAKSLSGRVRALSATHDLLTRSEWGMIPIRSLIDAELAPYSHDDDHLIELQGPEVELAPNDALSLGLAIHELATNAAKFGALSVVGGTVRIHWSMIADDIARVEWTERGGPPVPAARGRGFGTELIEKIVAHELGRPVDLRFGVQGVDCVLTVPVRKPAAFRMRAER